jgi:hypothetical protein
MTKLFLTLSSMKSTKWLRRVLLVGGAMPFFAQAIALSIEPVNPWGSGSGASSGSGVIENLLINVIDFAVGLLVVLAVALIIYAAYLYLFAGGEAEKVTTAKKWLIYVVVAIAVALLSRALVYIVFELFGEDAPGGRII